MKGPMMRLLYTVKMIYNISAFYNNSVRVASLLVKITYQAIISCKSYITNDGKDTIWTQTIGVVTQKLKDCIKLKNDYRKAYIKTRDRKMKGEVRKFNFSQQYIFGVFDSFCGRLQSIIRMFEDIRTFTQLFSSKLEALLADEVLNNDRIAFEQVAGCFPIFHIIYQVVTICKSREYDFLDYRNEKFNADFLDFNRKVTTTLSYHARLTCFVTCCEKSLKPHTKTSGTPHTPFNTLLGLHLLFNWNYFNVTNQV